MAHDSNIRQSAIALFKDGHSITDIHKQLRVPVRTLQRWLESYRERGETTIESIHQMVEKQSQRAEAWYSDIETLLEKHKQQHSDLADAIYARLIGELHSAEPSIRAIHSLSLAFERHSSAEQRALFMGRETLATVAHATSVLNAFDYAIIPRKAIRELAAENSQHRQIEAE